MHSRGVTLIELLVVMTISAILIAAAVPAFQWTIARNRISDATNQLLTHLEYARMESSRRGNTVAICRTLDPNAAPACSGAASATVDGNDWASGWIVFEKVPPNADNANFEAGDRLIFRQQVAGAETVRVMVHTNIGTERVAFQPRGTGGMVGPGTFAITYGTAPAPVANRAFGAIALTNAGRCIPITLIGSMRVVRPGVGTCPAP
jgi:prepilin-type N-terminal cleavage/methylation domain-containing protein